MGDSYSFEYLGDILRKQVYLRTKGSMALLFLTSYGVSVLRSLSLGRHWHPKVSQFLESHE